MKAGAGAGAGHPALETYPIIQDYHVTLPSFQFHIALNSQTSQIESLRALHPMLVNCQFPTPAAALHPTRFHSSIHSSSLT